jgi:hypothetical protein
MPEVRASNSCSESPPASWTRVEFAAVVLMGIIALAAVALFAPIGDLIWLLAMAGPLVVVGLASIVVAIVAIATAHQRRRPIVIGIGAVVLPLIFWWGLGKGDLLVLHYI